MREGRAAGGGGGEEIIYTSVPGISFSRHCFLEAQSQMTPIAALKHIS